MNETNGPGAEVLIESRDPHDIPEGKSARWVRDDSREEGGYWAYPAAPPQESDKGRGCGQAYHDERGEVQDCEEGALCRRCLERQLAEARAEVEALREEVALTNEHEHQILQERNEARDELATARAALLAYQEALRSAVSEARPALWCYPSGVLEYACPFCGEGTMRKRDDPQPQTVADIKHRDGCFVLVARPAPDVVPVPREEWEEYQTAKAGFRFAKGWTMICTEDLDALRSSAQAERAGAADAVTVPREEWEALRALFAAAGRAIHAASTGERATLEEINDAWAGVCSAQVALRSSAQGGKDGG